MPNYMGQNVQAGPYGADQMEIQRRQRLAQMLQQQSMEPIQAQQGGAFASPISPLQVLAKGVQAYKGRESETAAKTQQEELSKRMQSERQAALAKALSQAGGSPQPPPELGGGPAMPGDPMGAAGTLAGSQDPMLAQAGLGMMGKQFENQMPQRAPAPQPFTLGPGQQRFPAGGGQPTASVPPTPPQPPAPAPFTLGQGQQRFGPDGQPIASVPPNQNQQAGGTPYFTPVQTAQGIYAFNARTGQMELVRPGGAPVVGAAADPNLQRNLSSAKATGRVEGESTATRRFNMQGIGGIIQTADDILSGKTRSESGVTSPADTPTQSGLGTAVDVVGGFFGASPQGSVQAQQLKALGGALTAKMPRMQGPQSDRDVVLYRQMAAEIGDSTVPIARRKAALDTVKQLWAKYEHLNQEAFTQPAQPGQPGQASSQGAPAGVDPAIWNVMTPEEKALWQQ